MEVKMDSERSYSGDSSSSSDSSSGSSDGDEESMEPVRVLGTTLELPQELCEDYGIFKEFFSMKTWESLDEKHKENLKKFLPKFNENQEEETERTIKMLFNYEPFHFTSPLNVFFNNLKHGNYRPDIAKMRKFLLRARSKQQRHKVKSYYAKLLPEVLISRERVLAAAKSAPPGPVPGVPSLPTKPSKNNYKPVYLRAKQRYFEELAALRSEVGGVETDDENYPEGPPEPSFKKRKHFVTPLTDKIPKNGDNHISGTLAGPDQPHPTSLQCLKNVLAAHRARRRYRENHPELNTTGITLEDIKQRVAIVNGTKKLMFGGQKPTSAVPKLKRGPKKNANKHETASDGKVMKKMKEDQESVENRPLLPNIKIKCEQEESDSESSSLVDPVASPKQHKKSVDSLEIKQEVVDKCPNMSNTSYDPTLQIKEEPPDAVHVPTNSKMPVHQPVPIKLEDLDGIDMMALPIELADETGEVTRAEADEPLELEPGLSARRHANFLSLVRALFPARAAHRASKRQLRARCAAILNSPAAPLNAWYHLSDDWCADLDSALDFLAGERGSHPEDFVPYLQYMPETQVGSEEPVKIYQWIGAGRDCDAILGRLCERWMRACSPQDSSKEPPPPKYPTSWTVRPPTTADVYEFRTQERQRFTSAAKPFTYVQHGYRSVVGPSARAWGSCGGVGSSLLVPERPRHASFAALVRDALARLPNGEGTRHDVLTLIKMSQYLAQCSDQALLSAVSTVLERFSTAKRDPVVKFDQRTAIWTYLHRNKTEEDWLVKGAGRGRGSKAGAGGTLSAPAARSPASPPSPRPPPLAGPQAKAQTGASVTKDHRVSTSPHEMDMEVTCVEEIIEASDSDVDVDDSSLSPPSPKLSSAQLLMQATQTHAKPTAPQKPKKASPPHKRSYAPKQGAQTKQTKALMNQSVKQAALLAQSVKQATLAAHNKASVVQSVKNTVPKQTVMVQAPNTTISQVPKQTVVAKSTVKTVPKVNVKQPAQSPKRVASPKQSVNSPKQPVAVTKPPLASPKQPLLSPKHSPHSPMQPPQAPIQPPQTPMHPPQPPKPQPPSPKPSLPSPKPPSSLPKSAPPSPKPPLSSPKSVAAPSAVKTVVCQAMSLPILSETGVTKSVMANPNKSPLIKQRPLLKSDPNVAGVNKVVPPSIVITQQSPAVPTVIQPVASASVHQTHNKINTQGARSLLIKPQPSQPPATAATTPATQVQAQAQAGRRGIVRVLSPANPSGGKSLISPRALLQDTPATKKRPVCSNVISVSTGAQNMITGASVVNSMPSAVSAVQPRTVQLPGGRTVQLAANQTVHLPGGQAVQLSSGHTLQLSSLQLPTHSVRLPSGQTVQLATPQTMQAFKVANQPKNMSPRPQPIIKTTHSVPISAVQLAGQTVQIGGQTVQLAGQSVQLTGHTVKLPSGQSVQVASQNVLPSSVQLPSGQTVQLASGNVQTVQFAGTNVQLAGQSVQLQSTGQNVQLGPQTVQIGGQTVQIGSGQSVQLPSRQTIQLAGGQTVHLSSGQALQLASGQTIQLANQTGKMPHVVRSQTQVEKAASGQPIVAKLLTNAQGQMVSLEGLSGNSRPPLAGGRAPAAVRVVPGARPLVQGARPLVPGARPLVLASAKPLHNITLQQSDGTVRVASSGGASTSQTIVISNIASQTVTTPPTSAPVLKLQQVNAMQQVKLAQGIKLHQPVSSAGVATSSGIRSVLMDGQQLKLVGGRHVLARILRPAHPHNQ